MQDMASRHIEPQIEASSAGDVRQAFPLGVEGRILLRLSAAESPGDHDPAGDVITRASRFHILQSFSISTSSSSSLVPLQAFGCLAAEGEEQG